MAAMAMSYCRGMRCTNDQSRLALSTSPEDQSLYASVANRTLEAEGIGPMDKIKDYTLVECFRTTGEGRRELLLGLKKRGLGAGKFNGFGGKFDIGETAVECALRETREECGLEPRCLEWKAQLLFTFRDSGTLMRVHVFEATDFDESKLAETEEMRPQWFDVEHIPYNRMWHDDTFWLPLLLDGVCFEAWFDYMSGGEDVNTVAEYVLNRVPASPRHKVRERDAMSPP